jgi:membrane protease YdiL (CAAX protease family)
MYLVLVVGVVTLEGLFLQQFIWDPLQSWMINLGLWTEPSLPTPPHAYLGLNLIVLFLGVWLEGPEELYFRGYLQRQMTERLGAFWGITLSLLLWDLWHLKNPVMFVRRFFIGLCTSAIVFHLRGRVWGPMVGHPLVNRLSMALSLLRSR